MPDHELSDLYREGRFLNLAAVSSGTRALGPGLRAAVWVQGCPRRCMHCIATGWLDMQPNRLISPEELLPELLLQPVDGVTLSGGEPMLQAAGLARLVTLAKQRRDLNVICYTGYQYEALLGLKDPVIHRLLDQVDVLIDGPYIDALNDNRGLRGSSNQRVLHLTDRLVGHDFDQAARSSEIYVQEGVLFSIGVPEKRVKTALEAFSARVTAFQPPPVSGGSKPQVRIRTGRKDERA